jgi:hypothetical protein
MIKLNTRFISHLFTTPPALGAYFEILITLSLILAIIVLVKDNSDDKLISKDSYNLSIATLVIAFMAIVGIFQTEYYNLLIPFVLYAAIPLTLPILIIIEGSGNEIQPKESAIAITSLCICIYYMIVSGMFNKLINIDVMAQPSHNYIPLRKSNKCRSKRNTNKNKTRTDWQWNDNDNHFNEFDFGNWI